ncbi:phasin family protein [Microvirga zambiensis]|uniref:phasin family protein n=1 Tax=Microvirga zambiensis TaxID=1402137 RepID=UPI00191E8516|nr:phasin family protein [Microvirga zambiensis]
MTTMPKRSSVSDTLRSMSGSALAGDNSRALANAAETWLSATAECHREMMGFMSMRLDKSAQTLRDVLDCKSPADISAVQSRWMEETLRDYNAEMAKLMAIYTSSANGAAGQKK